MAVPKRIVKPIPLKGINTSKPGDAIGEMYASEALNVRFRFGEVRPTPGRGLFSGVLVNESVLAIGQFGVIDQDLPWPFCFTITKLFRRGDLAPFQPSSWQEVTGTLVPTGSRLWSWASGEDHLFFCRGDDSIMQWDGNPASQFDLIKNAAGFEPVDGVAGVSPAPRFVEYFNERLVCANVIEGATEFPNRVRWPRSGDYRKWDSTLGLGAGWVDIPFDYGEPINGMKSLGDQLAVYAKSSIAQIVPTGEVDPAFVYKIVVRGIGLGAPYTLAKANQVHFFLGKDFNVWSWDGINLQSIGDPIWEDLHALGHPEVAENYFGFVAHHRREYWLVYADVSRGSFEAFIFDFSIGAWSRDTFPSLTAIAELDILINAPTWDELVGTWDDQTLTWEQFGGGQVPLIIGGRHDGSTMVIDDGYAYDYFAIGSIMECFLETEDQYCPEEGPWKLQEVLRVILIYDPTAIGPNPIEVGVSFNQGTTWETRLVTLSSVGYSYADFNKTGQLVRYRFREKDNNVQFRWRSYGYHYVVSGDAPTGSTA